jgi:Tfp pilus assembly protein PilN
MMIKINLLPIESFRQSASGQLSVTIFAFVIIGAAVVLYLFKSFVMDPEVSALETSRNALSSEMDGLKTQSATALKQTADFTSRLIQADSISELEERRRDQTRLFNSLAGEVINQASWITTVTHQNGILTLRGMATDHEVVAAFLSNLEKNALLKNVDLIRAARDTTINNVRLVTFEIRGETVFPDSSLMENGLPDVDVPPREEITRKVSAAAPSLGETLAQSRGDGKPAL